MSAKPALHRRLILFGAAVALIAPGCFDSSPTEPPPSKPTLNAITPSAGLRGATVAVTLTGSNFAPGETMVLASHGVTVTNVNAAETSLTATFVVDAEAEVTPVAISVKTPAGLSGLQLFTIGPGTPTLTAVSPSVGVRGRRSR